MTPIINSFVSIIEKQPLSKVSAQDQVAVEAFMQNRHEGFGAETVVFCTPEELASIVTKIQSTTSKPIVLTNTYTPFTDFSVLEYIKDIEHAPRTIRVQGMVPGTEVKEIILPSATGQEPLVIRVDTQERYGSQLNLRKYKRLKLFLSAIRKWPELVTSSLPELMSHLIKHQTFFLNYGIEAPTIRHDHCPHCKCTSMRPLPATYSQALTGYTVSGTAAYRECLSCGLVVMSPHLLPENFSCFYDEYDAADMFFNDKDILEGPARHNHQLVIDQLVSLLPQKDPNAPPLSTIDIGGGPGLFSVAMKRQFPEIQVIHGDFDTRNSAVLKQANVETHRIMLPQQPLGVERFDLITAFEVIEHFDYSGFKLLIENIHASLRPGGYFVFTTPDFDSPMLQAFDWYNIGLPHHPIIFRRSWLKEFFARNFTGFTLMYETGGDDFMRDRIGYFSYFRETAANHQQAAIASLMAKILEDKNIVENLRKDFMQTEIIMFLQKRVNS